MITRFRGLHPRLNSKGRYAAEECRLHETRRKSADCTLRGGRVQIARDAAEECRLHETRRKSADCTRRGGRVQIARYVAEECRLHDTRRNSAECLLQLNVHLRTGGWRSRQKGLIASPL